MEIEFNSTEYSIIWFRDRYLAEELVLKPPYQRKPVWTAKQKSALIESILLGFPIPELYIQHSVLFAAGADKSEYGVVDGQQRIRTVLQFMGIDKTVGELDQNGFALSKLAADSQYLDRSYQTLTPTERSQFLKYKFGVRSIDADDIQIREIFKRINRYSTKLNEQELRNATYTGPFIQLACKLAEDDYWVMSRLVSGPQIRRMKDVEFISELLIGTIHGPQAGSASAITEYYAQYDDYEDEFPNQKHVVDRFQKTRKLIENILSNGSFVRFRSNRTDYYSIFVAVAFLSLLKNLPKQNVVKLRAALLDFEASVNLRLADESAAVQNYIIAYVRAVEKGANDKKRRADRHDALLQILAPFFS